MVDFDLLPFREVSVLLLFWEADFFRETILDHSIEHNQIIDKNRSSFDSKHS